jgi:hypothetical protein
MRAASTQQSDSPIAASFDARTFASSRTLLSSLLKPRIRSPDRTRDVYRMRKEVRARGAPADNLKALVVRVRSRRLVRNQQLKGSFRPVEAPNSNLLQTSPGRKKRVKRVRMEKGGRSMNSRSRAASESGPPREHPS